MSRLSDEAIEGEEKWRADTEGAKMAAAHKLTPARTKMHES